MYHSCGNDDNGGGCIHVETGIIWKISVSCDQFCEPKTALKKS